MCTICGDVIGFFHGKCLGCYRAYKASKEREYTASPEGKIRKAARAKRYNDKNRDSIRVYNEAWRAANPGYCNAWRATNRDKVLCYRENRRARELFGGEKILVSEWMEIQRQQRGACFDCGLPGKMTIGHLMPLCCSGRNDAFNIVAQHMKCNQIRGRAPILHFHAHGKIGNDMATNTTPVIRRGVLDRVEHIDGGCGTIQAYWVVFDDGDAIPCDESVLTKSFLPGEQH